MAIEDGGSLYADAIRQFRCHQKYQTNQLFEIPTRPAMVRESLDNAALPQVSQEFGGGDDVYSIHLTAVFVE